MNEYIDLYCERLIQGLWSEPLNAASNISFFIAAWFIWRLAKQQQKEVLEIKILIGLAIAIGTGSALFHTFATRWANFLDVMPILLFQLWFIWLYSRRVIRLKYALAVILIAGFFLASNITKQ